MAYTRPAGFSSALWTQTVTALHNTRTAGIAARPTGTDRLPAPAWALGEHQMPKPSLAYLAIFAPNNTPKPPVMLEATLEIPMLSMPQDREDGTLQCASSDTSPLYTDLMPNHLEQVELYVSGRLRFTCDPIGFTTSTLLSYFANNPSFNYSDPPTPALSNAAQCALALYRKVGIGVFGPFEKISSYRKAQICENVLAYFPFNQLPVDEVVAFVTNADLRENVRTWAWQFLVAHHPEKCPQLAMTLIRDTKNVPEFKDFVVDVLMRTGAIEGADAVLKEYIGVRPDFFDSHAVTYNAIIRSLKGDTAIPPLYLESIVRGTKNADHAFYTFCALISIRGCEAAELFWQILEKEGVELPFTRSGLAKNLYNDLRDMGVSERRHTKLSFASQAVVAKLKEFISTQSDIPVLLRWKNACSASAVLKRIPFGLRALYDQTAAAVKSGPLRSREEALRAWLLHAEYLVPEEVLRLAEGADPTLFGRVIRQEGVLEKVKSQGLVNLLTLEKYGPLLTLVLQELAGRWGNEAHDYFRNVFLEGKVSNSVIVETLKAIRRANYPESMFALLLEMTAHEDPEIRKAALVAVIGSDSDKAIPFLKNRLQREEYGDAEELSLIVRALIAQAADPTIVNFLGKMRASNPEVDDIMRANSGALATAQFSGFIGGVQDIAKAHGQLAKNVDAGLRSISQSVREGLHGVAESIEIAGDRMATATLQGARLRAQATMAHAWATSQVASALGSIAGQMHAANKLYYAEITHGGPNGSGNAVMMCLDNGN